MIARRVAHLLFDANLSGGQIAALRVGEGLRPHGWESTFVVPQDGPLTRLLDRSDFGWMVAPMNPGPVAIARLRAVLRELAPEVVHCHLVLPSQLAARLAARTLDLPVVCHYHIAPALPQGWARRTAYSAIDRWGANHLTSHNLAVSPAIAATLTSDGYRHVTFVPNGVGIDDADQVMSPADGHLVTIGRIARQKGLDTAIASVALLRDANPEVRLRIVGAPAGEEDIAYERELRKAVEDAGVGACVVLVGNSVDPRSQHLQGAGALLFPSRGREGMPLVVLEALAGGVPVVASDIPGVRNLIEDGVTGLLVPEGDPGAIVEAVDRLRGDHALRASLIANGRAMVLERFSLERMAARCAEIYGACVRPR